MLKYRVITALILIPTVIAALFMLPPLGFALMTIAVCALGAWEWGQLAGLGKAGQRVGLAVVLGGFLLLLLLGLPAYRSDVSNLSVSVWLWLAMAWWIIALFLVLFYPKSAVSWQGSRVIRLIFGALTLIPFFWGMVTLRTIHYDIDPHIGAWWLLYVMVLVWGADTGAYAFGKLFGKNKLAPKVSPGKTWEGLGGGLLTSALIALLFGYYAPLFVTPMTLLICSIITVAVSVLGDLTESMFKREAGIKDSSHLIPGHGGILDRIDSLTAAVPVFACLMLLVFGA